MGLGILCLGFFSANTLTNKKNSTVRCCFFRKQENCWSATRCRFGLILFSGWFQDSTENEADNTDDQGTQEGIEELLVWDSEADVDYRAKPAGKQKHQGVNKQCCQAK